MAEAADSARLGLVSVTPSDRAGDLRRHGRANDSDTVSSDGG